MTTTITRPDTTTTTTKLIKVRECIYSTWIKCKVVNESNEVIQVNRMYHLPGLSAKLSMRAMM